MECQGFQYGVSTFLGRKIFLKIVGVLFVDRNAGVVFLWCQSVRQNLRAS